MVNRKEFIGELAMLAQLSHPNVVQFLGAVTKTQPLVMVTEYLPKVKFSLSLFC
jgi:serine/threonine protein kinase